MYLFNNLKFGLGLGISAALSIINTIYIFIGSNLNKKESDECTLNAECKIIRTELFCFAFVELLTCMMSVIWFHKLLTKNYLNYFVTTFNEYVNYAYFYVLTKTIFFTVVHFCILPLMYSPSAPKNPVNKIYICSTIFTVLNVMQIINPFFAIYLGFNKDNRNDFEETPQDIAPSQYRIVNWCCDNAQTVSNLFSGLVSGPRNPQVPNEVPLAPHPPVSPIPAPARSLAPRPPMTPHPSDLRIASIGEKPKRTDSVNIPIRLDGLADPMNQRANLPSVTIHVSDFSISNGALSAPSTPERLSTNTSSAHSTPPQEITALRFESPSFSGLPPTSIDIPNTA